MTSSQTTLVEAVKLFGTNSWNVDSSMCKKSLDDAELSHLYLSVLESLTEVELQILTSLHIYAVAADKKMKNEGKELELMAIDYSEETIWGIKKSDFDITKLCYAKFFYNF